MSEPYTPSMEELREAFGFVAYGAVSLAAFDRAIAAHDAELRAEIAARLVALCQPIAEGRTP